MDQEQVIRLITENLHGASSVELSTSAKGVVQASVKVYDLDPQAAADRACVILDGLRAKYGSSGG